MNLSIPDPNPQTVSKYTCKIHYVRYDAMHQQCVAWTPKKAHYTNDTIKQLMKLLCNTINETTEQLMKIFDVYTSFVYMHHYILAGAYRATFSKCGGSFLPYSVGISVRDQSETSPQT
jgi:hypothetical protein